MARCPNQSAMSTPTCAPVKTHTHILHWQLSHQVISRAKLPFNLDHKLNWHHRHLGRNRHSRPRSPFTVNQERKPSHRPPTFYCPGFVIVFVPISERVCVCVCVAAAAAYSWKPSRWRPFAECAHLHAVWRSLVRPPCVCAPKGFASQSHAKHTNPIVSELTCKKNCR